FFSSEIPLPFWLSISLTIRSKLSALRLTLNFGLAAASPYELLRVTKTVLEVSLIHRTSLLQLH
ncbi:MAG: hypothetical protein N2381_10210, partial [Armatimonadetes bacterium]|nr:hypothetical protein [Armatimonadota bacterium]